MSQHAKKKTRKTRPADPNADREAAKYENPIPSREFLLEFLAERGEPLWREQIAEALDLTSEEELEALRRRLRAMERDGQVICNRRSGYAPVDKLDLVRGRVVGHADGFGFLVPDEGGDDLFLAGREMRALFHGDRVVAHVTGLDRRGRREGAVVEVLERNTHHVVGRYYHDNGVGSVVPDNKRLALDISVPDGDDGGAKNGQFVSVEIIQQPTKRRPPVGAVIEVLGDHMAPGMEIDVAIRAHDLPVHWPDDVLDEIEGMTDEVPEKAKKGRVDLRHLPLVTIDGADSRDFDDAVYCERKPKGWRLLVAIADVSHYVQPGSALDEEAAERGNSVYFPERVVPMLPEILSNGLCSLNPDVDRLCMVCEMYINDKGEIARSSFMEGLMRSHARLTYSQVSAILEKKDKHVRAAYPELIPHLEELYRLYKVLAKVRKKRGAIDFDTTETRIVFGSDRKIDSIVPVERNDAHKLIEECMIAANVATARYLTKHKMPCLYRIHQGPKPEKLDNLHEFLAELGLSMRGGKKPEARQYAELLAKASARPDAHLIQTVMLRSLAQAKYSPDNIGHFGLAHDQYAHFTSPIRRYPDLLVHRAIRHVLHSQNRHGLVTRAVRKVTGAHVREFIYTHDDMLGYGDHCSATDRRADEATRDAVDWLKCEFMLDKVGEVYPGIITGVTGFGIFVELADIYVEGLVHVSSLDNDFYHFDPAHHRLTGERSKTTYRLGDRVTVKVMGVNLDDRKIDFELVDDKGRGGAKKSKVKAIATRHPGKRGGRGGRAKDKAPAAGGRGAKGPAATAEKPAKTDGGKRSARGRRRR